MQVGHIGITSLHSRSQLLFLVCYEQLLNNSPVTPVIHVYPYQVRSRSEELNPTLHYYSLYSFCEKLLDDLQVTPVTCLLLPGKGLPLVDLSPFTPLSVIFMLFVAMIILVE